MNRANIIQHIEHWVKRLGSASEVAKKVGISDAALSQLLSGKYGAKEDQLLKTIALALDYKETDWQIVRTTENYKTIQRIVADAKNESMWMAISNPAGSGKTGALADIYNHDTTGSIIFVQCEEWTAQQFLREVVRKTVGEKALKGGYKNISELIQLIADYFNKRQFDNPLLIIDEADKLRPAALRTLIPLYNKTEDRLGLVMSGTENLRKEIERGVRLNRKGYDEIESRIGRTYLTLRGATKADVQAICQANGITDKHLQELIWEDKGLEKVPKTVNLRTPAGQKEVIVDFVEDFRRLKRIIKRELLKHN